MKTCGEEDAISDINGSVGEGSNEELVPAWVGGSKGQEPDIRPWNSKHIQGREVMKSMNLAPLVCKYALGLLKVRRSNRDRISRGKRDPRSLTCP